MLETEEIQSALNKLITLCAKQGGHVIIVDKKQNNFFLRLTEEIKIQGFIPREKGEHGGKNDESENSTSLGENAQETTSQG